MALPSTASTARGRNSSAFFPRTNQCRPGKSSAAIAAGQSSRRSTVVPRWLLSTPTERASPAGERRGRRLCLSSPGRRWRSRGGRSFRSAAAIAFRPATAACPPAAAVSAWPRPPPRASQPGSNGRPRSCSLRRSGGGRGSGRRVAPALVPHSSPAGGITRGIVSSWNWPAWKKPTLSRWNVRGSRRICMTSSARASRKSRWPATWHATTLATLPPLPNSSIPSSTRRGGSPGRSMRWSGR